MKRAIRSVNFSFRNPLLPYYSHTNARSIWSRKGLRTLLAQASGSRLICNIQPRGQSARERRTVRPGNTQIFIWMVVGPTCHFSLPPLFFQSRADLVPSPQRSPSPSISLLRPPNLDFSRRNLPRHLLHLPQTLDRLLPGRNRPHYRRTPLEVLEVCSTVDPPPRSSSTRTDRGNGFVVSSLCFTAFFPFHGASPAQEHGRRRRRRPCCRLGRGLEIRCRGRSAG